jgi:hypothetical protein
LVQPKQRKRDRRFGTWNVRSLYRNVRQRDKWGDPGVDGRIILGWIFRKWDVGVWTGLSWLRIETDGWYL